MTAVGAAPQDTGRPRTRQPDEAHADTRLDMAQIQGNVLRGYGVEAMTYVYLTVTDRQAAGRWLRAACPRVRSAASPSPRQALNIALTWQGLRALGVPDDQLATFPAPFREGMLARAVPALRDPDPRGVPGAGIPPWEPLFLAPERLHLLVTVAAVDSAAVRREIDRLVEGLTGLQVLGVAEGGRIRTEAGGFREHFGFADGISQPAVAGVHDGAGPGGGAVRPDGGYDLMAAGEFVLGYPDEEGVVEQLPQPDELTRNASYLVVRKLQQHVGVFRGWMAQLGGAAAGHPQLGGDGATPEGAAGRVAAKLVGRWPDGTPVAVRPDGSDPALAGSRETANAFDYRDDPLGLACPRGAHVRRMNPRGALPFDGKLVNRHRIIRRGLPYGPELPPGAPEDGVERGLIFACYQVDIERQFEFIQANWINDGNVFGLGGDRDPITGTAPAATEAGDHRLRKMTVPGRPPFFVSPLPDVVTVRGGEYFLVPGIDGLRHLATTAEQAPAPGSDEASTQKKATRAPRRPAARRRSTDQ